MLNAVHLRGKATHCRARATTAKDAVVHDELLSLAEDYEEMAAHIERLMTSPLSLSTRP